MITKNELVQATESAIDKLITIYEGSPFFFYTENDLHCFLYTEIFNIAPIEEWQCKTRDGKQSILLHKEYPTKLRYSAKNLKEVSYGGARGHFDLSIWNPENTEKRLFRVQNSTQFENEQQTFIGIEFDLIEGNRSFESAFHHFNWDFLKLSKNEVEHGYQLVFVRNWANNDDFVKMAIDVASKSQNVAVLYVEASKDRQTSGTLSPRPFLKYLSLLN